MGKPRMIILIRHAQSEGNKNRDIHQTIPDHRVKLTDEGWKQAYEAGRRLRDLLRPDDTLHFFTSPYRRTRETTEGIMSTLTSDDPSPSPFPRSSIKVYEEPRLREQDFGNFQPCSAEMERMWQERADYGHFFYRIPNGESAADAYDRVSGFNESLWRQFGEDDCASVCVLVTHGLMSRVFLMKWYHFSVEYFEDLRNVNHCEFLIMEKQKDSGSYLLQNTLRTWSQLKQERAAAAALREKDASKSDEEKKKDAAPVALASIPKRKQWGGCPNGCDHGKHAYKRENSMHAMQLNGRELGPGESPALASRRPAARRWQSSSEEEIDDPRGRIGPPRVDVQRSLDEVVSSPDGTPSYITVEERLRGNIKSPMAVNRLQSLQHSSLSHLGRDFGGTTSGLESGMDSIAGSDNDEASAVEDQLTKKGTNGKRKERRKDKEGRWIEESGMGRGARADALGDQSDVGSDGGSDAETLTRQKEEETSVMGSVF